MLKFHSISRIFIYGLLLLGNYYSAMTYAVLHDWGRDDYSYCYLIPIVVLYLLWEKRVTLSALPSSGSWNAYFLFSFGLLLFWVGELGGEYLSLYLSFWCIVVSSLWMNLGWRKLKIVAFPLFVMLTMFPLPQFLNDKMTFKLKLLSSQLGVYMMRLYGMSAYREGNVIDLGFTQLQVVDACSGLRYFFPLIIVGLLLAYFYRASFWKRAIIVISTIPLSIVSNSLRIALTGILYEMFGARVAEGFFHGFSGWFLFMFSLAILLVEMKILSLGSKRLGKEKSAADAYRHTQGQLDATFNTSHSGMQHATFNIQHFFRPPQFIVSVILLVITLVVSQGVEFREKIPINKPFHEFPKQIGRWSGMPQAMEQEFIDTLDLSDYVIVDYKNPAGQQVNFYVAYYESQRKGESIHSPATCLPGSGWEFQQAGKVVLDLPGQGYHRMPVNRAFMQKGAARQLSYFWFPMRGRVLTNAYEMKIFNFW
ncbi:MAG: VPLPA-CTERM-specific exosortase XrtD, partial [Syntrophaceae bacterium]|nr:VPLPA-CTERM-specific exosortase XrtD [Syntrophaceae bacterium]